MSSVQYSLFALCWLVIFNVYQWYTFDLEYISCEEDGNYKQFNTLNFFAADELANAVWTADGCIMFSVEYFSF